jgi:hypothetical protein
LLCEVPDREAHPIEQFKPHCPHAFVSKSTRKGSALLGVLCAGVALPGCCSTLAGCGESTRQGPARQRRRSAHEQVEAWSAQRRDPSEPARFFSPASIWNRALAAEAPLDPRSGAIVAALAHEVAQEQTERRGPWINTSAYGVPIVTVPADQPTVAVTLDHAPEPALSSAWSAVPLPPSARPTSEGEGYLVVWQPSTDRMWEFWQLARSGDGWHASWGGAIRNASASPGVYGPEAWPGAHPWWGATASSLALAGGVITLEQLRLGQIDHALAIAVPDVRAGVFAAPARRTDGSSNHPLALPEGAHLRLDPDLDLARLDLPPLTLMIAQAAQRYGIVVRDYASDVAFIAQAPSASGENPYIGPDGFFEGRYPSQLLASFPWEHLQLLAMDLHPNP